MEKIKALLKKLIVILAISVVFSSYTLNTFASKQPITLPPCHADSSSKLEKSTRTRAPSPPKKSSPNLNHSNNATFVTEQQAVLQTEPESTKPNSRPSLSLPTLRLPPPSLPERATFHRNSNNFSNSMRNRQMTAIERRVSIPEISSTQTRMPPPSLHEIDMLHRSPVNSLNSTRNRQMTAIERRASIPEMSSAHTRMPPSSPPKRNMSYRSSVDFSASTHNSQVTAPEINGSALSNPTHLLPPAPQTQRRKSPPLSLQKRNAPNSNHINDATLASARQPSFRVEPENSASRIQRRMPAVSRNTRNQNSISNLSGVNDYDSPVLTNPSTRTGSNLLNPAFSMPAAPRNSLKHSPINNLNCVNDNNSAVSANPNTTTEINLLSPACEMQASTARAANSTSNLTSPEEDFDLGDEIIELVPSKKQQLQRPANNSNQNSAISTTQSTRAKSNLSGVARNTHTSVPKAKKGFNTTNAEDDLEDGGIEIAFPPAANDTSTSISSEEDFGSDVEIIEIAPSGQPSSQLFANSYEENAATKRGNIAEIEKEIIDALNTVETLPIFDIHQLLNTIYRLHGHEISSELQNKIKELLKKIIARFIDLGTVTETIIGLYATMDALKVLSATKVNPDIIKEIMNDLVKQFADFVKNKPLVFEDFYDRHEYEIDQIKNFINKLKEEPLLSKENLFILDSLDIRSENIVTQVERAKPNMQENRSLDRLTSSSFPNSQREPTGNSTTQISPQLENEIPEPEEPENRSLLDRLTSSLFPEYLCETPNDCDPGLPPLSRNPFALPKSPK